jgi:hypothetical protein
MDSFVGSVDWRQTIDPAQGCGTSLRSTPSNGPVSCVKDARAALTSTTANGETATSTASHATTGGTRPDLADGSSVGATARVPRRVPIARCGRRRPPAPRDRTSAAQHGRSVFALERHTHLVDRTGNASPRARTVDLARGGSGWHPKYSSMSSLSASTHACL